MAGAAGYRHPVMQLKNMKFEPKDPNTIIHSDYVWEVSSLNGLLAELDQINQNSIETESLILYRGHQDKKWLIDSTFVRSFKTTLFGIEPFRRLSKKIVESKELHLSVLNLFLMKFGVLAKPSQELEERSAELNLDAWFEFLKRIQQYPEEDGFFLKGTNLIDWSESFDVALFFANHDRTQDGAIFVCNATATGNTHQKKPFGEILDIMNEEGNNGAALGVPLIIHPPIHIANPRPENQQVVYIAQMDMRYDLEEIWKQYSVQNKTDQIILKIILPAMLIDQINSYLSEKGIDENYIYPDLGKNNA